MIVGRLYQLFVPTLLVGVATVASVTGFSPQRKPQSMVPSRDAAYRDGLYEGRLHAQQGKMHIETGRWNDARDRHAYVSGYNQGYVLVSGNASLLHSGDPAYRGGMAAGSEDRRACRPFQVGKRLHDVPTDAARTAYANGYQEGYYGEDLAATGGCQALDQ